MLNLLESIVTGSGPLKIQQYLSPVISVETSVFGDQRQIAVIYIYFGMMLMYSMTLQANVSMPLPVDLISGNNKLDKGGTFLLTVPTQIQVGSVFASLTYSSLTDPNQPFSGYVASWPITSMVDG